MPKPFKPTAKQKSEIDGLIEKWKPVLFMQEWKIYTKYSATLKSGQEHCAASTSADCTYKRGWITFFPCYFDDDGVDREQSLVHELCHCITMIMKEPAYVVLVEEKHVPWHTFKEADERCTQQFANIIFEMAKTNSPTK